LKLTRTTPEAFFGANSLDTVSGAAQRRRGPGVCGSWQMRGPVAALHVLWDERGPARRRQGGGAVGL